MPESTATARIRAYSPRDEKEVRFMIGQAHMEPLAYANHRSECPLRPPFSGPLLIRSFISVLSSTDTRYMDWYFFHIRSLHGLVAEFLLRNFELATDAAGLLRPCGAYYVLR